MEDLFFYLSKLTWLTLAPENIFVILLSLSLYLVVKRSRHAIIFLSSLTFGTLFLAVFSVGGWLLYPLESRFQSNPELPEKIAGVIVLGGSIMPERSEYWQQMETNHSHERLSSFIDMANRYPDAKLVFAGGSSSIYPDKPTEAQFAEPHFLRTGISRDRLVIERMSRNTAENITNIKKLVKPAAGENWVLITSASHMPRAIGIACQQDWKLIPYPVDHQTSPDDLYLPGFSLLGHAVQLEAGLYEWAALIAYYLGGKTDRLFPNSCNG